MNNEQALKILIQGYFSLLQPNEGIIVLEDEDKDKGFIICKVWDQKNSSFDIEIQVLEKVNFPKNYENKEIKSGIFVCLHNTMSECYDAILDDEVSK